ncbi:hypothetical protein P8452_54325 [Trifolium repens]|nr:hypothetical protein P8452_54325 [Trifolium repens]
MSLASCGCHTHPHLIPICFSSNKITENSCLHKLAFYWRFDNFVKVLGHDPNCLSIDFPEVAAEKAFNQAEESIFYRHTVQVCVWKLQSWLQIGEEKKMTEACKIFDQFLFSCIASKREELVKNCNKNDIDAESDETHHVDLLTALIREEKKNKDSKSNGDKFLRDAAFNLFVAGRDTITSALTWLFPPIPFERKEAVTPDILPSGHHVNPNTMILFSLYAMGRDKDIWGEDYLEFKPERWISERGGIVYAPSYKFFSFNAGPRTCLGRDLAFIQVKMIAASILWNYCVHVVDVNQVTPNLSIVLLMKHGLKVKITKREI